MGTTMGQRSEPAMWELLGTRRVLLDQPRVMGILNVTPDSFSDGGRYVDPEDAATAAERFLNDGADLLDIGGESTRPGALSVSAAEQIQRVAPAIAAVRRRVGDAVPISVDTTLAAVAAAALDEGADAINDVSGGMADPRMLGLVAARGAGLVLMHRLAEPARDSYSDQYRAAPVYEGGVVQWVRGFLEERANAAAAAGIRRGRIMIDPGLGFGKSVEQNLELLGGTPRLVELGYPVLSALSRKSFTARAAGMSMELPPSERRAPSVALSVVHLLRGARVFRVHDVVEHARALRAAWMARETI